MMRVMRLASQSALTSLVVVLFFSLFATESQAQYRNNSLSGGLGWIAFNSLDGLNQSYGLPWGASDQLGLDVNLKNAIGYQTFLDSGAGLGFGGGLQAGAAVQTVVSLRVFTGIRYDFMSEKHRPFVAGYIQYLQFFNIEGTQIPGNPALGGQALWVGLRPTVGYEFFFMPEFSVQLDLAPTVYVNLDQAPKFGAQGRVLLSSYF